MSARIQDEFTKLQGKVSRQRIWQLRKKAQGLCIICGKIALYPDSGLCMQHVFYWNNAARKFLGRRTIKKSEYQPYGPRLK